MDALEPSGLTIARGAQRRFAPAWLDGAAAVLAFVVGDLLRVRRSHVTAAMRRAGLADSESLARAMYRSLARGLWELVWLAFRPRRPLGDLVALDAELLRRVRGSDGRGAVIATAHTGNWDLLACAAAERAPLTVVTKHLSIGWLDRLWQGVRARRGVRLISAGSAARGALRALGRGELVAALVDQAPERQRATIVVDFLGAPARVDLAPALLALRARVPLISVFGWRRGDGRHSVELAGVFEPPARVSRAWAEHTMRAVSAELEALVLRHPEQWLWMHRRWK
jgi:Kdo2-lipid IVA lauroyltransferase/acyltransferase